jgi:hypothetical protein
MVQAVRKMTFSEMAADPLKKCCGNVPLRLIGFSIHLAAQGSNHFVQMEQQTR